MVRAALEGMGARVQRALVIAPPDTWADLKTRPYGATTAAPVETVTAEHPQPGAGSERGGRLALALSAAVPADGELVVLLSGGASSLMAAPAEGLTLEDKRAATSVLLRSGADIYGLNTVRKHLSAIKGGRLAAACPAACRALVLSDVVGDDLSVIASGPTVPDASTYADALQIVEAFGSASVLPVSVMRHLEAGARGDREESPKPGDPRLSHARTALIGSRADAMQGAADAARRLGYAVEVIADPVVGEARVAGAQHARAALGRARALPRPACVIASGETTVHVVGNGRGGRNQEMTLAAAEVLAAAGGTAAFASIGTDGIDGPTDAAGAMADTQTLDRARAAGLGEPSAYLDANNAYAWFERLGDLVVTGPTGTNVGDLQLFLLA